MLSWWANDSYFNNEIIQIDDIVLMYAAFFYQDNLDLELGQNLFAITNI